MYGDRRSAGGSRYNTYGQDGFAGPTTQHLSEYYNKTGHQVAHPMTRYYSPSASYGGQQPSCAEPVPRKAPSIISWNPKQGSQGTPVYIYIQSDHDLTPSSGISPPLNFANRQCPATLKQLDSHSLTYDYVLMTDAPAFSTTEWRSPMYRFTCNSTTLQASSLRGLTSVTFATLITINQLCRRRR